MPHGQLRRSIVSASVTAVLVLGGLLVSPLPASAADDPGVVTPNVQAQNDAQQRLQAQKESDSVPTPLAGSVSTLSGPITTGFHPDDIISDNNFYGSTMTESAVQSFLVGEVPVCRDAQHTCLKDYHQNTTSRAADPMCTAYTGDVNESAARIIAKVGQACGISQRVILTLLQKESSIVDDTWPTPNQYAAATGYACPDTGGGCDPDYVGFYNQVYWAAWQYKRYSNPPATGAPQFTSFPVGEPSTVAYNPDDSCGSSSLTIKNQATAALYYYTPYQPNAAALAFDESDDCATFGNLNFWVIYTDWFGSTTAGTPPIGSLDTVAVASGALTIAGWAIDQTSEVLPVTVQISVTKPSGAVSTSTSPASQNRPDLASAFPLAGPNHGFTASVAVTASGSYNVCVSALRLPGNTGTATQLGCKSILYSASAGAAVTVDRIDGSDRYAVAVAISQQAFPSPATVPAVFIATAANYPDALAAGPAAVKSGGPLLLTDPSFVPDNIASEIRRLNPGKIVVVGGASAISDAVVNQLKAIRSNTVRISGDDRFATARAVNQYAFKSDSTSIAYVATGANFPDALSAGAAGGSLGAPIFLVNGGDSTVEPATIQALQALHVSKIRVVGGPAAVSPAIESALGHVATTTRVAGDDRFTTSVAINKQALPNTTRAFLATGLNFPDALAGSALAGKIDAPLFVVRNNCIPSGTLDEILADGSSRVTLIGGPVALNADVFALRTC